ncbi:FAD/NAD(P)-binding domain-containing protein [Aspergillus floccosus]
MITSETSQKHILIVGAGLTGLILAQALRHLNQTQSAANSQVRYSYAIYERDPYAFARGAGWSLTIHWALTDLHNILPPDILAGFSDCLVNPGAAEQGNPGKFQFLDLRTGQPKESWPIPANAASRVSREKLLALLMRNLDIQWSKQLADISHPSDSSVTAHFTDGSCATGDLLVGCDGARSMVRRLLCPAIARPHRLPVRLIGLRVLYPVEKVRQHCEPIDVHFFQGGDPRTNVYFWFSFIHLPRPTDLDTHATCQIMMSWPYQPGFLGNKTPTEMPESNADRLAWMRTLAADWAEPFRQLVYDLPPETELREIVLEDWPPRLGAWEHRKGTVTLVGDAAHGMTMFRGEAANHGVIDASVLIRLLTASTKGESPTELEDIIQEYESEMIQRTEPAVLKSRQACIDAHHYARVNGSSPLISKRAMKD